MLSPQRVLNSLKTDIDVPNVHDMIVGETVRLKALLERRLNLSAMRSLLPLSDQGKTAWLSVVRPLSIEEDKVEDSVYIECLDGSGEIQVESAQGWHTLSLEEANLLLEADSRFKVQAGPEGLVLLMIEANEDLA